MGMLLNSPQFIKAFQNLFKGKNSCTNYSTSMPLRFLDVILTLGHLGRTRLNEAID